MSNNIPPNLPRPHSPSNPQAQRPQQRLPQAPLQDGEDTEAIDIFRKDDRFDDRPLDPEKSPGLLDRLRDWMASAFESAAVRVREALGMNKVPSIRDGAAFDDVKVSAPFNVRQVPRSEYPKEIQDGIAKLEADKAAEAAEASKQAFVQGADLVPPAPVVSPDEEDFRHYLSSWREQMRQKGGQPDKVLCPQNFVDGARRFASSLLDLEQQRRAAMEANDKDYWLAPDDQERLEAAAALFISDDDAAARTRAKEVLAAGPVQTVSSDQALSFHAWRDWKRHPDKLPVRENFSLDAAVAYAQRQIQAHAAGAQLKDNQELRTLVGDATELIANQHLYEVRLDEAWLLASLDDLRASDKPQPSDQKPALVQASASPPPPAPAARPAPPARRERAEASAVRLTFAERMGLPDLGSLAPEDRMMAEETFGKFVEAFRRNMAGFRSDANADYLYPECVAVADDYAEKIIAAQDAKLSDTQRDRLLAALRLRELYAQYRR